jgi:outer membrane protein OmpA-like peptidoglycan-associated protein
MRRLWPVLLLMASASCTTTAQRPVANHPFVVFFAMKSSTLEPAARAVIADAAAEARAQPGARVAVLGYTDSAGSQQADLVLSRRRAQGVADMLVRDGVPAAQVVLQGRGQTHDDPGVESRRVEIRVGG